MTADQEMFVTCADDEFVRI